MPCRPETQCSTILTVLNTGCSGAGIRGNAIPIGIFVWERHSLRNFCTSGNGVPTLKVCILTAILKVIPNTQAQ